MATTPTLGGTTLPDPSSWIEDPMYWGGHVTVASGATRVQLANSTVRRTWSIGWVALTAAERTTVLTGFDNVKASSGTLLDVNNVSYTVIVRPDQPLTITSRNSAGGLVFDVSMRLIETV